MDYSTPTKKRRMLRAGLGHPGHEKVYCPKAGGYRLLRRDDEGRYGDGFGANAGKLIWEQKRQEPNYRELQLHVTIEGCPLAGKSTVVRNMAEYFRARGHPTRLMLEVPESWRDAEGESLLEKQLENPTLYSMHLQCLILARQGKMLAERGGYPGLVLQDRWL